jgi:hypothetical protein
MTLELINATTALSRKFSREFVGKALELACLYGWQPLGTRLREMQPVWLGSYLTNDGQMVLAKDALSLAEALTKALDEIPNVGATLDWDPRLWVEDDMPEWLSPEEREVIEEGLEAFAPDVRKMHPLEFFAGDEKPHLVRLIRFCRLGSFVIL